MIDSTPTRRATTQHLGYTTVAPDLGPHTSASAGLDAMRMPSPLAGMRRNASPLTPFQGSARSKKRTLGTPASLQQEQFLDNAWTKLIAPYVTAGLDTKAKIDTLEATIEFANLERACDA